MYNSGLSDHNCSYICRNNCDRSNRSGRGWTTTNILTTNMNKANKNKSNSLMKDKNKNKSNSLMKDNVWTHSTIMNIMIHINNMYQLWNLFKKFRGYPAHETYVENEKIYSEDIKFTWTCISYNLQKLLV